MKSQMTGKRKTLQPLKKTGRKKSLGTNYWTVSHTSVAGEIMEQNLLEATLRQIEDREVIWENQLDFTKSKTYLTNLKAFYDGATTLMDKERVPRIIYLDCIKVFDMVHHNIFFSKFETYGFDQQTISRWRICWIIASR